MWRRSATIALLVGGCLYTDPINQRPVIDQMAASPPPMRSDRDVTVTYDVYDPDGDSFDVQAHVLEVSQFTSGPYQVTFKPTGPGKYTVVVSATDSLGANSGERHIVVDVPNMTPQVSAPRLDGDLPAMNHVYPLGTTFTIVPGTVDDDDANPTVETYLNGQRISVDTFRALTPGHYDVQIRATDSHNVTGVGQAGVDVATDRAPCIVGTSPDAGAPHLLTAVGETRRLQVTGVDDDLNPWPANSHGEAALFQWLIGPGDGSFRVIPNWTQPYYDLDGSGYAVGAEVQVRVIVRDLDRTHEPNCDPMVGACPTITCPAWVTWNLEFFQ